MVPRNPSLGILCHRPLEDFITLVSETGRLATCAAVISARNAASNEVLAVEERQAEADVGGEQDVKFSSETRGGSCLVLTCSCFSSVPSRATRAAQLEESSNGTSRM